MIDLGRIFFSFYLQGLDIMKMLWNIDAGESSRRECDEVGYPHSMIKSPREKLSVSGQPEPYWRTATIKLQDESPGQHFADPLDRPNIKHIVEIALPIDYIQFARSW